MALPVSRQDLAYYHTKIKNYIDQDINTAAANMKKVVYDKNGGVIETAGEITTFEKNVSGEWEKKKDADIDEHYTGSTVERRYTIAGTPINNTVKVKINKNVLGDTKVKKLIGDNVEQSSLLAKIEAVWNSTEYALKYESAQKFAESETISADILCRFLLANQSNEDLLQYVNQINGIEYGFYNENDPRQNFVMVPVNISSLNATNSMSASTVPTLEQVYEDLIRQNKEYMYTSANNNTIVWTVAKKKVDNGKYVTRFYKHVFIGNFCYVEAYDKKEPLEQMGIIADEHEARKHIEITAEPNVLYVFEDIADPTSSNGAGGAVEIVGTDVIIKKPLASADMHQEFHFLFKIGQRAPSVEWPEEVQQPTDIASYWRANSVVYAIICEDCLAVKFLSPPPDRKYLYNNEASHPECENVTGGYAVVACKLANNTKAADIVAYNKASTAVGLTQYLYAPGTNSSAFNGNYSIVKFKGTGNTDVQYSNIMYPYWKPGFEALFETPNVYDYSSPSKQVMKELKSPQIAFVTKDKMNIYRMMADEGFDTLNVELILQKQTNETKPANTTTVVNTYLSNVDFFDGTTNDNLLKIITRFGSSVQHADTQLPKDSYYITAAASAYAQTKNANGVDPMSNNKKAIAATTNKIDTNIVLQKIPLAGVDPATLQDARLIVAVAAGGNFFKVAKSSNDKMRSYQIVGIKRIWLSKE